MIRRGRIELALYPSAEGGERSAAVLDRKDLAAPVPEILAGFSSERSGEPVLRLGVVTLSLLRTISRPARPVFGQKRCKGAFLCARKHT